MKYKYILEFITSSLFLMDKGFLNNSKGLLNNIIFNPSALDPELANHDHAGRDFFVTEDGIGIINICGPIMRYSEVGLCMDVQSTQSISQDLSAALKNTDVKGILLHINSPGGVATGISELSGQIKAASQEKPVFAYIEGTGASAAYWLASAADKIVINKTGMAGSIGAVFIIEIDKESNIETIEIVSSQSPNKRLDLKTDEGRTEMQTLADDLAKEFIDEVAQNRGVTPDFVMENYGKGSVMMGKKAVNSGLADEVGTFESAINELRTYINENNNKNGGLNSMNENDTAKKESVEPVSEAPAIVDVEAVKTEAIQYEQERVGSIIATFGKYGLTGNAKMAEMIANTKATKTEALEACLEIVAGQRDAAVTAASAAPKVEKTLAEKELEKNANDAKKLNDVVASAVPVGQTGNIDMQSFTMGYASVRPGDTGGN